MLPRRASPRPSKPVNAPHSPRGGCRNPHASATPIRSSTAPQLRSSHGSALPHPAAPMAPQLRSSRTLQIPQFHSSALTHPALPQLPRLRSRVRSCRQSAAHRSKALGAEMFGPAAVFARSGKRALPTSGENRKSRAQTNLKPRLPFPLRMFSASTHGPHFPQPPKTAAGQHGSRYVETNPTPHPRNASHRTPARGRTTRACAPDAANVEAAKPSHARRFSHSRP